MSADVREPNIVYCYDLCMKIIYLKYIVYTMHFDLEPNEENCISFTIQCVLLDYANGSEETI